MDALVTTDVTDNTLQRQLGDVLQVQQLDAWKIVDQDGDLYQVHSNLGTDRMYYSMTDGAVLTTTQLVSTGLGYMPLAVADSLQVDDDDNLLFSDLSGIPHWMDDYELLLGFEALVLRIFAWEGT